MKKHILSFIVTFLVYYLLISLLNHQWKDTIVDALFFAIVFELLSILFDVWQNKRKANK
ncbi:lipopolysaccharide export LptBFGC system permease protein LptF [Anoxybacillus calidus]|jgi:lipopolysaccharide export LptBFGC system permease protein LptF|uniref:Lipopolysaccharide export LptBFGC system permease protein LptF n=1 Tax=[Anoxybacillus] calidus TaxID=575178 RepID=A0A7V9YYT2_9BACL|nr:hypothetical protein [Anoxybacillus calidus]MBA2870944.1 lipopolysaccharide export LptBFGC system permease protein LptF [Anoxybacillus calidus]